MKPYISRDFIQAPLASQRNSGQSVFLQFHSHHCHGQTSLCPFNIGSFTSLDVSLHSQQDHSTLSPQTLFRFNVTATTIFSNIRANSDSSFWERIYILHSYFVSLSIAVTKHLREKSKEQMLIWAHDFRYLGFNGETLVRIQSTMVVEPVSGTYIHDAAQLKKGSPGHCIIPKGKSPVTNYFN